jgi:hypothetical protein
MSIFREQLDRHGIAATDATVLARGWKLVDALNGQTSMFRDDDRRYRVGQVAARLAAGTLTSRDVRAMQRLLAYCAWDKQHLDEVEDAQIQLLRRSTYQFLGDLPRLEGDLQHWIRQVAQLLHREASSLSHEVAHTGGRTLPAGSPLKEHDAAEVFTVAPSDLRARTVHSFKGEDADAVMVVIRRPHASDPTSQLELWEAAVAGADIDPEKEEERRVLFVALTRARRYCLVALPDNPRGRAVAEACVDLGFATVPSGD